MGPCSLEIGAGGGLVGLAVAKGCAVSQSQPLYVTDQLEMLTLMEHNIVLNEMQGRVKPMILNWYVSSPSHTGACHALYTCYPQPCLLGTPGCCHVTFVP